MLWKEEIIITNFHLLHFFQFCRNITVAISIDVEWCCRLSEVQKWHHSNPITFSYTTSHIYNPYNLLLSPRMEQMYVGRLHDLPFFWDLLLHAITPSYTYIPRCVYQDTPKHKKKHPKNISSLASKIARKGGSFRFKYLGWDVKAVVSLSITLVYLLEVVCPILWMGFLL